MAAAAIIAAAFSRLQPRDRSLRYVVRPRYIGLGFALREPLEGFVALMRCQRSRPAKTHATGLCALPAPDEMIWHKTGIPTLLVTYGVSTDLFFSGHTGLAVLGAVELARTKKRPLLILGICIALFEAATVLILRAHYTMDVFTGAVTALLVSYIAALLAPRCDTWLARWTPKAEEST